MKHIDLLLHLIEPATGLYPDPGENQSISSYPVSS
jgi:hypothetical protein